MNKFAKIVSIASAMLIVSTAGLSVSAAKVDTLESKNSSEIAIPFTGEGTTLDVDENLPSSYSSKDLNLVTPIRQQGNAQICWAYGGLSSLETLLIKDGVIDNFSNSWYSAAHVDAWGTPRKDGTGWQREYYKGGGFPYITMGYLSSWSGGVSENEFPYTSPLSLFDINKKYNISNILKMQNTTHNISKVSYAFKSIMTIMLICFSVIAYDNIKILNNKLKLYNESKNIPYPVFTII